MGKNRSPMEFVLGALTLLGVLLVGGFYLYDRFNPLQTVAVERTVAKEVTTAEVAVPPKKIAPPAAESGTAAIEKPVYELKTQESEYLWDLEHHNNVLSKHGFEKLIDAWRDQDREVMLALFDEDFHGKLIRVEDSQSLELKTEMIDVWRHDSTEESSVDADREALVDWLLEFRLQFADEPPPRGRLDVRTIEPPESEQGPGTWTVTCIHRLWGRALDGGALEVTVHLTIETDDLTKERLAEPGWLQRCDLRQVASAHTKQKLFRDVTDESGIDPTVMHDNWLEDNKIINTGGVYACDFNHDGFTDLLITDEHKRFFFGRPGGQFDEATDEIGLDDESALDLGHWKTMTAAFADLDNDGWEDLILPVSGRVYRNEKGKSLRDVTHKTNLGRLLHRMPPSHIGGIAMADYDRDGLIDLYVARSVPPVGSWLESRQPKMIANQLIRNEGDWFFTDVTKQTDTGGGGRSCFTAVWTDVNNDRWPDLYIINEFGDGALYVNQDGKSFRERDLVDAPEDFGSMGLACGDVNNDGNIDLYVSNMYSKAGSRIMGNMKAEDYPQEVKQKLRNMVGGGEMYLNQGDLKFKTAGQDYQVHAAGWAWGSSLADFDNDGWLDLYVTAGFMSRDRKKPDG